MTMSFQLSDRTEIEALRCRILSELAALGNDAEAEAFRIKYLGKKGMLRELLKGIGSLSEEHRRAAGALLNALYREVEERFASKPWSRTTASTEAYDSVFDPTLPPFPLPRGSLHPLLTIRNEIRDIFVSMGFDIAYGPEVESEYYNFGALNFPPHHPARDMQDTFIVSPQTVLRTHTSPVQIRVMEQRKPPIRCIMPGRVYRREEINSRSFCLFHQIEGLFIDHNVTFADLKGTLLAFAQLFFGSHTRIKIRPSYFPFTEPSVEVDVECFICKGKGCSVCKQSGWLEIMGAGMVHPNVLAAGGIDSEEYTGFAFGMGVERIALLRYTIDDIRFFFENDIRFLLQF